MQFLKSFFESRINQSNYPNQEVVWSENGLAFFGDLTSDQVMAHADRFLRGNHKAGIRRALNKGVILFIERAIGSRGDNEKSMDVDWFAKPTMELTLFEEEALRRLVNVLQSDVQRCASDLLEEGNRLSSGMPAERTLVRAISTDRFVVEIHEVPPAPDIDLDGEDIESIYLEIEAGRQRFLGLEVAVKASGVVLGCARVPGILNEAHDRRYGGMLYGLASQAIEDTREFIGGVTL